MASRIPSFRDFNKITVGVISIAVLAAMVVAAFAIGTLRIFEDTYTMSAVFEETGGVKSGSDVRVAGVEVGRVTVIEPDFDAGQVVVEWEIDSGVRLGPMTTAEIAPATLLGGFYLRLSGPVEAPYMEDVPAERRRIPLERTRSPVSIIGALGDTTRQVQQLDIPVINQVVGELARATERNREEVPSLVNNLGALAAAVNDQEQQLRQLVANAQQVGETLASRDQQLVALIDTAGVLLDQLSARRSELEAVLGAGSSAVTQLADLIANHRTELDAILGDAHVILQAVERNLPTINESLAYAGPTFALLSNAARRPGGFDTFVFGLSGVSGDLLRDILEVLLL